MWHEQANIDWERCVIFIVACYHSVKLSTHLLLRLSDRNSSNDMDHVSEKKKKIIIIIIIII